MAKCFEGDDLGAGERRRHPRLPFTVGVEIYGLEGGRRLVETRDVGHGGVLLGIPGDPPPVGSEITLRVAGDLGEGVEPPLVRARIARVSSEGVAVEFITVVPRDSGEDLFD